MATPELRELAQALLDHLMVQFPLRKRPELGWKSLRVTAGIAYYRTHQIALSTRLLVNEERLRITLIHEYAHLLAVERHGRQAANHGPAWRQAMLDLGLPPIRTHDYEVERNAPRQRVIYQCQHCGVKLVRARRLPKRRKYMHSNCGGGIRLIAVEKTTISDVAS